MKYSAIFALVIILISSGCHSKRPRVTALPPPVPVVAPAIPEVVPEPPPPPEPEPVMIPSIMDPLEEPDAAYYANNYTAARTGYQRYLEQEPYGEKRDQALFRLAMTFAMPSNNSPDWPRITTLLRQLVDQHPLSPYRPQAIVILALQSELSQANVETQKLNQKNKQLSSEIDRMRQADLDRRKRP